MRHVNDSKVSLITLFCRSKSYHYYVCHVNIANLIIVVFIIYIID